MTSAGLSKRRTGKVIAEGTADFEPLARLTLTEVIPADDENHRDVFFDPVSHGAPEVQVWPDWLKDLRASAYRGGREGRAPD